MAEPILSPDGKWMWTGSEWIPAPPSSSQSTKILLQDSVVGGDINITQNNAEDIATAMVRALERMGFSGQSSPAELTPSLQVDQIVRRFIRIDWKLFHLPSVLTSYAINHLNQPLHAL